MKKYLNTLALALVLLATQSAFGQYTDRPTEAEQLPSKTFYVIMTQDKQVVREGTDVNVDISGIAPGKYILVYEQKNGTLVWKDLVLK